MAGLLLGVVDSRDEKICLNLCEKLRNVDRPGGCCSRNEQKALMTRALMLHMVNGVAAAVGAPPPMLFCFTDEETGPSVCTSIGSLQMKSCIK